LHLLTICIQVFTKGRTEPSTQRRFLALVL